MAEISRRGFLSLGIGALAVASLPVAIWRQQRLTRRSMPIMGTVADIVVLDGSVMLAHAGIDNALAELRRVERMLTRFDAGSDIGRVNLARVGDPVAVSAETASVVAAALRWAEDSDGAYDPAIGAAVQLWDVTRRQAPPDRAALKRLAGRRLYRAIEVGTFRGRPVVVRRDADAHLDLGGIGKGYGVDRATARLRDAGITDAIVDVGGDLVAIGAGPDGDGWSVGIQSPRAPSEIDRTLKVTDAAVATSGTYAQFFAHQGRRYHHLIDPRDAAPRSTAVQSFTVRAESCLKADVAATACFGMSGPDRDRVLGRHAGITSVASII